MKPLINQTILEMFRSWRLGHKFVRPKSDPSLTLAERIIEVCIDDKASSALDLCGGTGAVSYTAKLAGLATIVADISPSAFVRLKALVENNAVALAEGAIEALFDPSSKRRSRRFENLYGKVIGQDNAAMLDALEANLSMLDSEMEQMVAIASVVAALERQVKQQHFHIRSDRKGLCGAPNIKEANLADDCRDWLREIQPKLLIKGRDCTAYEMDAVKAVKKFKADAVIADVPYGGTATGYSGGHALPDNIVRLLLGGDIGDPFKSNLGRHHDFGDKHGARSGLWRILYGAKNSKVVVICHNSNAALKPDSIVNLARLLGYGVETKTFKVRSATTKVRETPPTVEEYLFICRPGRRTTVVVPELPKAVATPPQHVWHPALKPAMELSSEPLPESSIRTFGDFFSGVGGFRLAGESLGLKCVFSSEIESVARAVYRRNFGDWPSGDITKINPRRMPAMDMICGGWPCQGISIANVHGKGLEDDRSGLFFVLCDVVRAKRPKLVVLENSDVMMSPKRSHLLAPIKQAFEKMGYDLYCQALMASRYKCPQARERTYFVAFDKALGVSGFTFPEPVDEVVPVKAIMDSGPGVWRCELKHSSLRIGDVYPVKESDVKPWHPKSVLKLGRGHQGQRIYDTSHPGITLMASGGGNGSGRGIYQVGKRYRTPTDRELARLNGFPETFKFGVCGEHVGRLMGNSVVMPVVRLVMHAAIKAIAEAEEANHAR